MKQIQALLLTHSHFNPTADDIARLKQTYPMIAVTIADHATYDPAILTDKEIIAGFPKPAHLQEAKALRWLQTPSSGVGQYMDRSLFSVDDVMITNAKGTYGRQIASYIIGSIIGFNHHLFTYRSQMAQRLWKEYLQKKDLWDSTLLIIGFGDIGNHAAQLAKAHGMRVLAVKRTAASPPEYVDALHTIDELDTILPEADYVALAVASTDQTNHLIDRHRLSLMKRDAYLINVGRGNLVDQDALIDALQANEIGGAALDVTNPEPLEAESPLWAMENVLITPHASGLSHNDPARVYSLFFENLGRYVRGEELKNRVDFTRGY
jgi:phosphoglycerate dehydrogenase-like enzyme